MNKIILRWPRSSKLIQFFQDHFRTIVYIELWDDMKKTRVSFWNKKTKEYFLFTI